MWRTLLLWQGIYMILTFFKQEGNISASVLINNDLFVFHFNRTVPLKIWSCLSLTVSQDLLVDRSLQLQTISALCRPLKTPQIGFHFYVSLLHLKTTLTLGSSTRETQCEIDWIYVLKKNHVILFLYNIFIIYLLPFNLSSTPKPGPSFQRPVLSAPAPVNAYSQGNPIYTLNDQYFTIPQVSHVYDVYNNCNNSFVEIILCLVSVAKVGKN